MKIRRYFQLFCFIIAVLTTLTACNTGGNNTQLIDTGITGLKFPYSTELDIEIKVGEVKNEYVSVRGNTLFTLDDIKFLSSDSAVATVEYDYTALNTFLYFKIIGISEGEAEIHVETADGKIKSQVIKVTVLARPESDGEEGITSDSSANTDVKYILNTSSKKFHLPDCYHAKKIVGGKNAKEFSGTKEELIAQGYQGCKSCNP